MESRTTTLKKELFKKVVQEAILSNKKDAILILEIDEKFYKFATTRDLPNVMDRIEVIHGDSFIFQPSNYNFLQPLYITFGLMGLLWTVTLLP